MFNRFLMTQIYEEGYVTNIYPWLVARNSLKLFTTKAAKWVIYH